MNPEFIDRMGWEMAEVYGAVTDQILINLARHFPYYKPGGAVPKSAFEYQAQMLAQMGQVNRETIAIIRNGLKGANPALASTLEQAIIDSVSKAQPELIQAVKKGVFSTPQTPVVAPNEMRAFQLYYKQASDKLNLVNTVMLESTGSAYRQAVNDITLEMQVNERLKATQTALDVGAGETISGVSSWNEAVRHSITRMKENGITGFIDHAGHRWSAEAYTAMDIRTTAMNTGRAAIWETNENFGNDLYLVSYHNGARPLCYDWQNKVISSANQARETFDLDGNTIRVYAQSETTYGQPAGLFGINCKHYPSPFIPGVSIIRGEPQDPATNEQVYKESQTQRGLERKLREEKRDILMAKAQGASKEEIKALQDKARQTSAEIDEFCDKTGRARHRDREGVYTRREFPDKEKYDVAAFERTQKEQIEQFYKAGGAQQQYKSGVLNPKTQSAAQQPAQPQGGTQEAVQLDAKNFPDEFNKKKTKIFVDTVNATEGANADVAELFNTMGAQVNGQAYPIKISYTEDRHAVEMWAYGNGNIAKLNVKIPKLADAEYLQQEIGTTAHELGHLFDHMNMNGRRGTFSATFGNGALPNALQNARPMSERVKTLIENAVRNGNAKQQSIIDLAKGKIGAIDAEISKALSEKNYGRYNTLAKERKKIWEDASKLALKESRKAHNGLNAVEDIYDAISGGSFRDKTNGLYGHGSKYYGHNPAGENAAAETFANYCSLALAYPDLFEVMAEEQPEIWKACGDIVKAMIGR